jgi:hypothetical protein
MTIQELGEYAKIIGPIITGLSVFFGVVYFVVNIRRERVKQTLDYWEKINQQLKTEKSQLRDDYGTKIDSEMAQLIFEDGDEETRINRLLNIYERLALGINIGAYDIKVLNKLVGQNIINNYVRFEEYIELRRTELDRPFAWREFQKLSERLKKLRK